MSLEFWITTLVVVATPGTGALYTIAAITGLAALLHGSAVAFNVVKYLGVVYLVYLAVMTWRDRSALVADGDAAPLSAGRVIGTGVLINLLNPKLTIFFFAFLPLFVHPGQPDTVPLMLALSAIFMAVTFAVFAGYGLFAAAFRRHVIRRPRVVTWMRRSFATAYVVLAARLAIPERT